MGKRTLTFILFLSATGAALFGLTQVRFDGDGSAILPGDLPEVQGFNVLRGAFSKNNESILILKGPGHEPVRAAAHGLAEYLDHYPGVVSHSIDPSRVRERTAEFTTANNNPDMLAAGAALLAYKWLETTPEEITILEQRLSADEMARLPNSLKATLSDNPFGLITPTAPTQMDGEVLVNTAENGRFRVIHIRSAKDNLNAEQAIKWHSQLKYLVADWRQNHPESNQIRIQFTGEPAYLAESVKSMQRDLTVSIALTLLCILVLFLFMHRHMKAMLGLLLCICYILLLTLGLGGMLFDHLNFISIGFAAILLGLSVDYGMILYQESLGGERDPKQLRRAVGLGILWAALTTIVVFYRLNFSSIPGIEQLGILVAMGIAIAAAVMFFIYPVLLTRIPTPQTIPISPWRLMTRRSWRRLALTPLLTIALATCLWQFGLPDINRDFTILRPKESKAIDAFDEMKQVFNRSGRARIALVLRGANADELWTIRETARQRLELAIEAGEVDRYFLPGRNINNVKPLLERQNEILHTLRTRELLDAEALQWMETIFAVWQDLVTMPEDGFKSGNALQIAGLDHLFARDLNQLALLGFVEAANRQTYHNHDFSWADGVIGDNVMLAGWEIMGPVLLDRALEDFHGIFIPLGVLLIVMLFILFRDTWDVLLCIGVMIISGLGLLTWMRIAGWEWNFINLFAVPLLFGIGIDFSIHMILSLRRVEGDMPAIRRGIRKAMLFCALTSAAGFGSLAFAGNAGLASLGGICAAGILIAMVFSVYFLPQWWLFLHRRR